MKDDSIYIDHILNSINRIIDYTSGKDRESFEADLVTQDAVVRKKQKSHQLYDILHYTFGPCSLDSQYH